MIVAVIIPALGPQRLEKSFHSLTPVLQAFVLGMAIP
jgi:hypothetical protein